MKPLHAFLLIVAGMSLLSSRSLPAQAAGAPFDVSKQYSADLVMTMKDGRVMTQKIFSDNGKIRTEMKMQGMEMVMIARPDEKKAYNVMVEQKMVMETDYDPSKIPTPDASSDSGSKFEVVGPDTAEGVACTKYKVTSKDGRVVFYWVDTSKKALVKMMPADGAVTMVWKNFTAGPQDASLFEVPSGYQVMKMPAGMGKVPGGAGQ